LKLCKHDYIEKITLHANFGLNQYSGDFSQIGNYNLSCPLFFLDPAPSSNRWIDLQALWLRMMCFRARTAYFWVDG